MRLYFLRHGAAYDRDAWTGSDFDRPLTREGRERLAREAKAFAKLSLGLGAIVTSPLVRAKETAAIVAGALDAGDKVALDDRLGPEFDMARLAAILGDHRDAGAVMLVGHEPNMSETVGRITGATRLTLKKGGLAYVELPNPPELTGTLVWLLAPKVLLLSS